MAPLHLVQSAMTDVLDDIPYTRCLLQPLHDEKQTIEIKLQHNYEKDKYAVFHLTQPYNEVECVAVSHADWLHGDDIAEKIDDAISMASIDDLMVRMNICKTINIESSDEESESCASEDEAEYFENQYDYD